ncbi:recombinase family protein [Oscillospiraceae bacterium 21-37]
MARKSRKNVTVEKPVAQEKVWQAALYIRLSVEFNGNRGDSLETQRQIMEAYLALCPDIEIAEIYTDNGSSGRTFERAGFQKMLADIEAGKINCVVVKDLSRLGRNAIDSGFYLEKYFPLHQVRFISVNDQYDSETADSGSHMIVPLKNMVNEAYAADISRKVKAQQRQAMQEGQFVGGRPPYGYLKDPHNCHKLVVNPDTAPVVKKIFQWIADGTSVTEVAKRLNEAHVLTPGHYLASVGIIRNQKLMGAGDWQTRTLERILADEVYIGHKPNASTTRAMVVTILYRLEQSPVTGNVNFNDVASGTWYTEAVAWASSNGIVNGYGNGNFGPNDSITREQMATILHRYICQFSLKTCIFFAILLFWDFRDAANPHKTWLFGG